MVPWHTVADAFEVIVPKLGTAQFMVRFMLSETVLVLHAPIPLAVNVNVSVAQTVLKDWYVTGVPVLNTPTPDEDQLWLLALATVVPVIAKGTIGCPGT